MASLRDSPGLYLVQEVFLGNDTFKKLPISKAGPMLEALKNRVNEDRSEYEEARGTAPIGVLWCDEHLSMGDLMKGLTRLSMYMLQVSSGSSIQPFLCAPLSWLSCV